MKPEEYADLDATALAALIRDNEVSCTEAVEAAIDIAERRNPDINAMSFEAFDHARKAAKAHSGEGVFAGVPFLLKEALGEYPGWPDRKGSRSMAHYVSQESTELIRPSRGSPRDLSLIHI